MRPNFNLIEAAHNPVLQFLEPGESLENASSQLANAAQLLRLGLTPNDETVFEWTATYPTRQQLLCIYFERISLTDCKMVVYGRNGTSTERQIASFSQVDDYLLSWIGTGFAYDTYRFQVIVPDQGATPPQMVITPPFLGSVDLCDIAGSCYLWGREYQHTSPLTFQHTANQAFPQSNKNKPVKSFPFSAKTNDDEIAAIDFISKNLGQITLFIEYEKEGRHHITLGYAFSDRTRRNRIGDATYTLTVTAKNAR